MANATMPQVVQSYLDQLETALAGIPGEVRAEIVAGVREELEGLDATEAATRIEELGDPEFIAAEARAEAEHPAAQTEPLKLEPTWYPVLAALLVSIGGAIVPVVGWIVGLAMVWLSKSWSRTEKWVATLTPFLAVLVASLIVTVIDLIDRASERAVPDGDSRSLADGFHAPFASDFQSPLIPTPYDLAWSGVLLFMLTNVVVGIWLLWRLRGASHRARPGVSQALDLSPAARRTQPSWYSVVTVLLIIAGGYLVPVVGWLAGVVLLWAGPAWTTREKWLGTLAGPLSMVMVVLGGTLSQLAASLSGFGLAVWHTVILGVLVAPLVANVIVGMRLLRRAGDRAAKA